MSIEGKYSPEHLALLDELGFKEYDPGNGTHIQHTITLNEGERLFIEEDFVRQRIFITISELENGYHDFYVYMNEDIGCDTIPMPFRWSELRSDWLTYLKLSLSLHGFMKDGQEVKLNHITT